MKAAQGKVVEEAKETTLWSGYGTPQGKGWKWGCCLIDDITSDVFVHIDKTY